MHNDRTAAARGARALLALAMAAVMTVAAGCGVTRDGLADVAVLGGEGLKSRVWRVDTQAGRVVSESRMRSLSLACAGDRAGRVVTAQCGGLGEQVDDALGIVDGRGRVTYVELPAPNPTDVAVSGDVAVVLHGYDAGEGMWMSAVDLRSGSVITTAAAEGMPQRLARAGGEIVMTCAREDEQGVDVVTVDPRTLSTKPLARLPLAYAVPAADPRASVGDGSVVVVGFLAGGSASQRAASSRIFRLDTRLGSVVESLPATGLSNGAFDAAYNGEVLAIVDATTAEPTDTEGVTLYGRTPLRPISRIDDVSPRAVAVRGSDIVLADGRDGRLKVFGLRGALLRSVEVGAFGDVARVVELPSARGN